MRRVLVAVALLVASLSAAAQFGGLLNSLGKDVGKVIDKGKQLTTANKEFTVEEEIAIGEGAAASFLGAAPLHPDQNLQRYVNRVGRWLSLHADRPDLPWTFGVVQGDTINAFALPGGTIVVSHGLLKQLKSESELAGVLAHEIAHVVKRHQIQAIQSSASTEFWTGLGKEIASDRVARSGGGALAQVGKQKLLDAGTDFVKGGLFLRPLDRKLEYEADSLAVVIAARSGYDPYGLVSVLQMLAQVKGDDASIMATHPAASERMAELERGSARVLDPYAAQPQLAERFRQAVR